MHDERALAARIAEARIAGERIGLLPAPERPRDAAAAYRVQDLAHEILSARGQGEVVGYKIGCTTPVMQLYLGIGSPCSGGIVAHSVFPNGATVSFDAFRRVGVECEVAVLLERDLAAGGAPFTAENVAVAVGSCMAAIEIVDDRYEDWRRLDAPMLIADDFFGAGCVLGTPVSQDRCPDLAGAVGLTRINGREVGRGRGSDVMGHPFQALAWLANALAARGRGLAQGDFVLTGSLVETRWLERGDTVEVEVAGLGAVRATFA